MNERSQLKTKVKNHRLNKQDVESNDKEVNENNSKTESFKHFLNSRFQFEYKRFSMNKRKTDRLKINEKNKQQLE